MNKKCSITGYTNGFIARFDNRRIECFRTKDDDFIVVFIKWTTEPFTEKDLQAFDTVIERFGGHITYKRIRLSENALSLLSEGFLCYINRAK